MSRFSAGLARAIRAYCDLERHLDRALIKIGYRRLFYSQKGQDRWVIRRVFAGRPRGYFVDVGAGDGISHSNTFALERDFNWTGILIEANPEYIQEIRRTRTARCINICVDSQRGEIDFLRYGYLSGIIGFDTDNSVLRRPEILRYNARNIIRIQTMRLTDVLDQAGAPSEIDYLSIDVEGAEHRVLAGFSFTDFRVKAISIERPSIATHKLLVNAGFVLDKYRFHDGFYLCEGLATQLSIEAAEFPLTKRKLF